MKVILTAGNPNSGHEQVFALLNQAGIFSAQVGSKTGLSPQAMQKQLLRAQEVNLSMPGAPLAQVQPGKLWHELATDIFLTHIQHDLWGWADYQTLALLDFWRDFDPQVRLLLVYNPPEAYLQKVLGPASSTSAASIDAALNEWLRWNTMLLRYFQRHPQSCILINSNKALAQPQVLLDQLAHRWLLSGLGALETPCGQCASYEQLQAHLILQMSDVNHPAWALHQELEGTATWPNEHPSAVAVALSTNAQTAWLEWVSARTQLADLSATIAEESLAKENALVKCDNLAQERLKLQAENAELQKAKSAVLAQLGDLRLKAAQPEKADPLIAELKQENELLLLQLHQVQEELERYFLLSQDLEKREATTVTDFATNFWRQHPPETLCVDFRQDFAGHNWYPAEVDGRWAGPTPHSSIDLPALQPGEYTIELDVVDAMRDDIVSGMQLEAFGVDLPLQIDWPATDPVYPLICTAGLSIAAPASSQSWQLGIRFTHLVSPADNGSDDQRQLAVRLRTLRVKRIA